MSKNERERREREREIFFSPSIVILKLEYLFTAETRRGLITRSFDLLLNQPCQYYHVSRVQQTYVQFPNIEFPKCSTVLVLTIASLVILMLFWESGAHLLHTT